MTTPTDHDLNVSLARLMGRDVMVKMSFFNPVTAPDGHTIWPDRLVPDYRGSLDALFAPGGPVEYAQDKHGFNVVLTSNGGTYEAEVLRSTWAPVLDEPIVKDSPAEALATALHEAFMKEQGQ